MAMAKTKTDHELTAEAQAELAKITTDTAVVPAETVNPVDTRDPDANYDSRSNIVRP